MTRKLLYLALLALAGCVTNAPNSMVMQAGGGNPEIVVRNSGLQSTCEIVGGQVLYEGDILLGIANVRSHVDEKRQYNSRWRWYDADGVEIRTSEGQQVWRSIWVDALDEPQITGRAPTPGAVKAEFQLRWVSERDD